MSNVVDRTTAASRRDLTDRADLRRAGRTGGRQTVFAGRIRNYQFAGRACGSGSAKASNRLHPCGTRGVRRVLALVCDWIVPACRALWSDHALCTNLCRAWRAGIRCIIFAFVGRRAERPGRAYRVTLTDASDLCSPWRTGARRLILAFVGRVIHRTGGAGSFGIVIGRKTSSAA